MAARTEARPSTRGWRGALVGRVSAGHLVMVVAGLVGGLSTLAALRAAEHAVEVVVVDRTVAAGDRLAQDDVSIVRMRADGHVLRRLVVPSQLASRLGAVVAHPLTPGDLLRASDLTARHRRVQRRTMSFPVERARAVGGALSIGDHVDVLAVARDGGAAGYVLVGAEVLAVDHASDSALRGSSDQITLSVAVDGPGALRLTAAQDTAVIEVVRATDAIALRDVVWFAQGPVDTTPAPATAGRLSDG